MLRLVCMVAILPAFLLLFPYSVAADSLADKPDLDTLIHVHVVWRHGDRTPSILMPTDTENGIKTWPDGLGEITRKGLEQQYHLGELIRLRYDGFLSDRYSPFEIYIRSSDYNRTLTSAQANLLGMYPPDDSELFLKGLRWRPIPVHTVPKPQDKELFDRAPCPYADAEEDIVYNSEIIRTIEKDNHETLKYLGEKSGYTTDGQPMRLRNVWKIFDPIWAESNHPDDHKLPEWIRNETVRTQLFHLYHIASSYLYGSPLLKRLRAGPLFSAVLGRMENRAFGHLDPREKLYAYSAHDTAVAALLSGFGITPQIFPEYATAAFVELHKVNNSFIVKLLYKNDTHKDEIFQLDIPYCAKSCTLQDLRAEAIQIIPNNWEEECGWYHITWPHFYIYAVFAGSVFVMLLIVASIRFYRSRFESDKGRSSKSYRLLEEQMEFDPTI